MKRMDGPSADRSGQPQLKAAAVYDASRYDLDHPSAMEQELLENRLDGLMGRHGLAIDARGFVHVTGNAGPA